MGDLISRKAAVEAMKAELARVKKMRSASVFEINRVLDCIDVVKKLPDEKNAVTVIHGQWVEETDRYFHWHCSECGSTHGIACKAFKYCPNCGAKMDGDTE